MLSILLSSYAATLKLLINLNPLKLILPQPTSSYFIAFYKQAEFLIGFWSFIESFENEFRFRRFLARPALDQCCQTLQLRLRVAQVHLNS